jgi:DNA-binding XRE family transcriptional regulator
MTAAQVQSIRDRVTAGENKSALAREFKVTRQTIYNIIAG